jgi:hypothetical protein
MIILILCLIAVILIMLTISLMSHYVPLYVYDFLNYLLIIANIIYSNLRMKLHNNVSLIL